MNFTSDKAIYLQMADRLCDDILAGNLNDDDRIPSVREYAVSLEVNTNTAMKAYDTLAREGIIYNRRGLGYYVTQGARAAILEARRQEFLSRTLPGVVRQMRLLGLGKEAFAAAWGEEGCTRVVF